LGDLLSKAYPKGTRRAVLRPVAHILLVAVDAKDQRQRFVVERIGIVVARDAGAPGTARFGLPQGRTQRIDDSQALERALSVAFTEPGPHFLELVL